MNIHSGELLINKSATGTKVMGRQNSKVWENVIKEQVIMIRKKSWKMSRVLCANKKEACNLFDMQWMSSCKWYWKLLQQWIRKCKDHLCRKRKLKNYFYRRKWLKCSSILHPFGIDIMMCYSLAVDCPWISLQISRNWSNWWIIFSPLLQGT